MKLRIIYLINLMCCMCVVLTTGSNYLNPDWKETHAWANDKDPLRQLCPQQIDCNSECSKNLNVNVAYKRLVSNIFDRRYYKKDDATNYLYRTLHIHVTEEQLLKLNKLRDAEDIDGLVAEILAQTKFGAFQIVKEYTVDIIDVLRPVFNIEIPPRAKSLIVNFILLLFAYLACRRFQINFLVVMFFTAAYFLYEYLDYECHKRIAIEETVDMLYGADKNPCDDKRARTWWQYMFGGSSKAQCREYLEKIEKSTKKCGMVDLFHEFTAHLFLKQLKLFFLSIADMVQSLNSTYGMIATAITLFFMKDLLTTTILSVFKYILNPSVWASVVSHSNATEPPVVNMIETSRVQAISSSEPDIRDINLGKALDLANNRIKLALFESQSTNMMLNSHSSSQTTSSVQVLSIEGLDGSPEKNNVSDATKSDVLDQSNQSDSMSLNQTDITELEITKASVSTTVVKDIDEASKRNDDNVITESDKSASSESSDNSDYVVL